MQKVRIKLTTIENIKSFISILSGYAGDADVVSGRYTVDAKSIMGLFSLDMTKPLSLRLHGEENREILQALENYLV